MNDKYPLEVNEMLERLGLNVIHEDNVNDYKSGQLLVSEVEFEYEYEKKEGLALVTWFVYKGECNVEYVPIWTTTLKEICKVGKEYK